MDLIEKIKNAGIIGAGGAGFPTHAKLAGNAESIILNGAECEPLLRVDQQLMSMFSGEIISGLVLAGKLVKAEKAYIGIKEKHGRVISDLKARIHDLDLDSYVEIKELPDVYPMGDEQVLVHEVTGRIVPEKGIPLQVGCVVINPETALNIFHASSDLPVTETYLTIAGDVPHRMTVKVPVGTPLAEVIRECGVDDIESVGIIDGGPMMGAALADPGKCVTKKSKGFIILDKDHYLMRKKSVTPEQAGRINRAACEQCRMCTDGCPRYLLGHDIQPHLSMRIANYQMGEAAEGNAQLCCQCNICELFSCPAGLFPRMANVQLMDDMKKKGISYTPEERDYESRAFREYRMIPSKRLIARLDLTDYDRAAPYQDITFTPEVVRIATDQHVGAPAHPVVSRGDTVSTGQVIGEVSAGDLGSPIHSSISGTVSEVSRRYIEIRRK